MIIIDCEQGSPEWTRARLGIPTASEAGKLVTGTGKYSEQDKTLLYKLLAEWAGGKPADIPSKWIPYGLEMEPEAREWYEFAKTVEVRQVGFIKIDDGRYGCSPDGMVGDDGLLEIKCPSPWVHLQYLLSEKVPSAYFPQIQMQLLVTGAQWCDFLSFHPDFKPLLIRVERDEKYLNLLRNALSKFCIKLDEKKRLLMDRGIVSYNHNGLGEQD